MIDFARALADPDRYLAALERLHARLVGTRRAYEVVQAGVPLGELFFDAPGVARKLARVVGGGRYHPDLATTHQAMLDRQREIFSFGALDLVVHATVGDLLTELLEPRLSASVWSYRSGRSSWQALAAFARVVRRQRRHEKDPRQRGFYVFRGDVRRYVESVPLGARSPLWSELAALTGLSRESPHFALLEKLVRPTLADETGALCERRLGVPMGSPVANPLLNLYLAPVDDALDALGGFYARYGDDLLFAHERWEPVARAARILDEVLAARELQLNQDKVRVRHLNAAGRDADEAAGTVSLEFLGAEVTAEGTLRLPRDKWRELLAELRGRLRLGQRLLPGATLDERAHALIRVVEDTLDPRSPLAHPHAAWLARVVTDRRQLDALDRWLWRALAETLTGQRGIAALRHFPPRRLRARGLRSLVERRNHEWGRFPMAPISVED